MFLQSWVGVRGAAQRNTLVPPSSSASKYFFDCLQGLSGNDGRHRYHLHITVLFLQ